jgi:diguanylate cyclase (GGDEF)-like protein
MIVHDTMRDSRFEDNPLVTGKPRIRFYAGDPIRSAEGHKLGAFCLIDTMPRSLNQEEVESLRDFTRLAEGEMNRRHLGKAQQDLIRDYYDLQKKSMVDPLTRLWNRGAILEVLDREMEHARRDGSSLGLLMADIDHFKKVNDTRGHPIGDEVLREVARRIRSSVRLYDIVGRIGGEEFLVLLPGLRSQSATEAAERIRIAVKKYPVKTSRGKIFPTLSLGVASYPEGKGAKSLIEQADAALYAAKRAGRDCVREAGVKADLCHSS